MSYQLELSEQVGVCCLKIKLDIMKLMDWLLLSSMNTLRVYYTTLMVGLIDLGNSYFIVNASIGRGVCTWNEILFWNTKCV